MLSSISQFHCWTVGSSVSKRKNQRPVKSGTVLPTARDHRDISSKGAVWPAEAVMRMWVCELVTRFGVKQEVEYRFAISFTSI